MSKSGAATIAPSRLNPRTMRRPVIAPYLARLAWFKTLIQLALTGKIKLPTFSALPLPKRPCGSRPTFPPW